MTDITYSKGDLFTTFYKVLTIHAISVIEHLRKAGYAVRATKVSKPTLAEIDTLFTAEQFSA